MLPSTTTAKPGRGRVGSDAGTLIAEPLDPELGRVGKVDARQHRLYIERLLDSEYIPVIATVAAGRTAVFSTSTPTPPPVPVAAGAPRA